MNYLLPIIFFAAGVHSGWDGGCLLNSLFPATPRKPYSSQRQDRKNRRRRWAAGDRFAFKTKH